jgi:hypothetical protein
MPNDHADLLTRAERYGIILAAIAATVGLVTAINVVDYLPTHDGPQHVLMAHIDNHYSDPGSVYPDYYYPSQALVARGFSLVFSPLENAFGWRLAHQITLSFIVVVWAWGVMAFVNGVEPRRRLVGLVGFASAIQWSLYMGFFSYLLSTGLGFFILAIAFRHKAWGWSTRLILGTLLAGQAVCHVFGAEAVGLVLIILVMVRAPWRSWPKELGLLAAMGVPTMYLAAYAAGLVGASRPMPHFAQAWAWLPWPEKFEALGSAFTAGPWWRAFPPLVLATAGLGFGVHRTLRKRATPEEKALMISSALFLLAAIAFPLHMPTWEFISPRFTPLGVVLALPLLPVEMMTMPRVRAIALAAATVLVGSSIAWAGWQNRALARACGPALAGLDAPITRTGPRLPLVLDTGCNRFSEPAYPLPHFEPALNLGALYGVQQGGIVPYTFAGVPQMHSVVFHPKGMEKFPFVPDRHQYWGLLITTEPRDAPRLRAVVLTGLAAAAARFEDLIFYGSDEDRAVIEERGWDTDWSSRNLWIARYRGCPTQVQVLVSGPQTEPLLLEWGWTPDNQAFRKDVVDANTAPSGGVIGAKWEAAGCGPAWVRVGFDVDGSKTWSERGGHCEGAGSDGRVAYNASRGSRLTTVRCTLVRP